MSDDLTSDLVRAQRFEVARKGYDRAQVDRFVEDLASRLAELEASVAASTAQDPAVGIDDHEALARELHMIGEGVAEILEAARSTAEGMRSRAASDAASWTAEAEEASVAMRRSASEESESMRASAWTEGTALLAAATAEADAMVAAAKEETLYLRAEAEREALRLTSDARRDREEGVRSARAEAEQIIDAARTESEAVLAAAHQQAELAQERARALEERRTELLHELEAARSSITVLESEIESKRQELEEPVVEEPDPDDPTHHTEDGGSVRIVSPSSVVSLSPVDPDAFVAEVAALRAEASAAASPSVPEVEAVDEAASPADDAVVPEPPVVTGPSPKPDDASMASDDVVASDSLQSDELPARTGSPSDVVDPPPIAGTPVAVEVDAVDTVAPVHDPEAVPEVEDDGVVDGVAAIPAGTAVEVPVDGRSDEIGSLFAQLRDGPDQRSVVPSESGTVDAPAAAEPDPSPLPVGDQKAEVEGASGAALAPEGAESTPSSWIPMQNDALRSIKRSLVELQNETLEHLRTDSAWVPDESFMDRFTPAFGELADAVGHEPDDLGSAFATDLHDAVSSAIERTRGAGGGDREVAAAASKVFRMWRSDEAERRVFEATGTMSPA
jgi:DivIVA domain-containing protein